jgi:hypothetical protein
MSTERGDQLSPELPDLMQPHAGPWGFGPARLPIEQGSEARHGDAEASVFLA